MVKTLGTFLYRLKIVAFGYKQHFFVCFEIKKSSSRICVLNESKKKLCLTDGGTFTLLTYHLERIENPHELATWLDGLTSVVNTVYF